MQLGFFVEFQSSEYKPTTHMTGLTKRLLTWHSLASQDLSIDTASQRKKKLCLRACPIDTVRMTTSVNVPSLVNTLQWFGSDSASVASVS